MKFASYAIDRGRNTHRGLSVLVCVAIVLFVHSHLGFALAIRALLLVMMPAAGIWFAEAFVFEKPSRRYPAIQLPRTAGQIRFVCWFVLLGVPAAIYLFFRIS